MALVIRGVRELLKTSIVHMKSGVKKQLLEKLEDRVYICHVCNVRLRSPEANVDQHMKGKKHLW